MEALMFYSEGLPEDGRNTTGASDLSAGGEDVNGIRSAALQSSDCKPIQ